MTQSRELKHFFSVTLLFYINTDQNRRFNDWNRLIFLLCSLMLLYRLGFFPFIFSYHADNGGSCKKNLSVCTCFLNVR